MRSFAQASVWCLGLLMALGACQETTRSYVRNSGADPGIMATVSEYAAAYNRKDIPSVTAAFIPGAWVVSDGTFNPFSKTEFRTEEFVGTFSDAMSRFPLMKLGEPHVFIVLESGDRAVLELVSDFSGHQTLAKFSLQREGSRWAIAKVRYY